MSNFIKVLNQLTEDSIDKGVAQAEVNVGYKAARNGEERKAPNPKLAKYWLSGYDAFLKDKKKDQDDSDDWHDKQKLGKIHR